MDILGIRGKRALVLRVKQGSGAGLCRAAGAAASIW